MERGARLLAYGELPGRYILRSGLGQVTRMIEWNEKRLKELVRRMGLRRTPDQGKTPIHLSLYGSSREPKPLLTKIVCLNVAKWSALGYTETDRVSVVQYLSSLGCRTDGAWSVAVRNQQPLTLELAKALLDAGAFGKDALWIAAQWQQPLPLELVKLLIEVGCDPVEQDDDGWDALVHLAVGGHSVDPQVTDLFLSAGCRTNLDGCDCISGEHRLRFDQILKEHAEWKESLSRMVAESSPTNTFYGPDWSR